MTPKHTDARDAALQIVKKLRAAGHTVLFAGGCVRDALLGRTPKDYDVVTDATPERLKKLFPRAREVGVKFGVLLLRKRGHDIEVATFRSDGPYADGRHPDDVTFGSEVEDARRRDFTINGLFLDPIEDRVIDHVNGRADIEAGILRTIGDPDRRFAEDHLRLLRAVRFAARLDFRVEPATAAAIRRHGPKLASISVERIWMELELILTDPSRARGWSLLVELGLREHLSLAWPVGDDDALAFGRLEALSKERVDPCLALAAVLADRSHGDVEAICRSLRLSNRLSRSVVWLVDSLPRASESAALERADLKLLMADKSWPELLELVRADLSARGASPGPFRQISDRASRIDPDSITPPPLVTGDDLCAMGLSPGPRMGRVLDAVYRAQLNERITTRDDAVKEARRLFEN